MTKPNWFLAWPVTAGPWFRERVLGPAPPDGLRLFAAEDLHITLAFLGAVGEQRARAAFADLDPGHARPLLARLGPVLPFGPPRRFSALSSELGEGSEELIRRTRGGRDRAIAVAGGSPESRAPRPHLTLARVHRKATAPERRAALGWAAAIDLSEVTVRLDRLCLYTWSHDRELRQFRIVETLEP